MNFGFQNILAANGLGITLTGMLIVLAGMVSITLFIAVLPRLLGLIDRLLPEQPGHQPAPPPAAPLSEAEIFAGIAAVMDLLLQAGPCPDEETLAGITLVMQLETANIAGPAGVPA